MLLLNHASAASYNIRTCLHDDTCPVTSSCTVVSSVDSRKRAYVIVSLVCKITQCRAVLWGTLSFRYFPQDGSTSFIYVFFFPRPRMRENISSLTTFFWGKKSSVLDGSGEENKDFYIWAAARQKGEIAGGNFGFH